MGAFSVWHMLVVLAVALLLFGAGRVSELGKGMGEGIRAFKKGLREDDEGAPAAEAPIARRTRVVEIEVDEDAGEAEIRAALARQRR